MSLMPGDEAAPPPSTQNLPHPLTPTLPSIAEGHEIEASAEI
jgi:hypothetical protein